MGAWPTLPVVRQVRACRAGVIWHPRLSERCFVGTMRRFPSRVWGYRATGSSRKGVCGRHCSRSPCRSHPTQARQVRAGTPSDSPGRQGCSPSNVARPAACREVWSSLGDGPGSASLPGGSPCSVAVGGWLWRGSSSSSSSSSRARGRRATSIQHVLVANGFPNDFGS